MRSHASALPFDNDTIPLDHAFQGGMSPEARLQYHCYGLTSAECLAQRTYNHGYETVYEGYRLPAYRGGPGTTGTYLVTYTPYIRGDYQLDIKVPATTEVQRITTSVNDDSTLGGNFTLSFTARDSSGTMVTETTDPLTYDSKPTDIQDELIKFTTIYEVEVNRTSCSSPETTCTWYVTFVGTHSTGNLHLLGADTSDLTGNNVIMTVADEVEGVAAKQTTSAPYITVVDPNDTNAPWTTAFGRGLVAGTAGEVASFTIQSKDSWGNDRRESQPRDMYRVFAFVNYETPEDHTGVEGTVEYIGDGAYKVDYVPTTYGLHTVAVMKSEKLEIQVLNLTFADLTTARKGGTFTLLLNDEETDPMAWDVSAERMKIALEDLEGISTVDVSRFGQSASSITSDPLRPSDAYMKSYIYSVTFSDFVGDVELLELNTTLLPMGSGLITTFQQGKMSHIKAVVPRGHQGGVSSNLTNGTWKVASRGPWVNTQLIHEVQVVRLWHRGTINPETTFKLMFNGHITRALNSTASAIEVEDALQELAGVGSVFVERRDNEINKGFEWQVEFRPSTGSSLSHLMNYGNLPTMVPLWNTTGNNFNMKVYAGGASGAMGGFGGISPGGFSYNDGLSPFVADIKYTDVSPAHSTPVDQPHVTDYNGLSTGVFEFQTSFTIEARDKFSNRVEEGPLKEVQIIQTKFNSTPAGTFTVSYKGSSASLAAKAGPADLEAALESLPDIGAVTVTTQGVKQQVKQNNKPWTAELTQGSEFIFPTASVASVYDIGDWIRLGNADGPVFTVVAVETTSPYKVTLSSPYFGEDQKHGLMYEGMTSKFANKIGYQYIVTYDSNLGDLPALQVDASGLRSHNSTDFNATAEVIACDWYVQQIIETSAMEQIGGSFYISYKGDRTVDLRWDIGAEGMKQALETLDSVYTASVYELNANFSHGAYAWTVRFDSIEGEHE